MPKKPKLKNWIVTLEYHSVCIEEVEAATEEEAISIAEGWIDGNRIACNATSFDAKAREVEK